MLNNSLMPATFSTTQP